MKKLTILNLIFFTTILFSSYSLSYAATSANGTVSATVINPISISNSTNINFGTFSPNSSAGYVSIGGVSGSSGSAIKSIGTNAGSISVVGSENAAYTVIFSADDDTTTVSLSDGNSHTMNANLVIASGSSNTLLNGNGNIIINGSLDVSPSQPAGSYSGSYNVEVAYQ